MKHIKPQYSIWNILNHNKAYETYKTTIKHMKHIKPQYSIWNILNHNTAYETY